MVSRYLGRISYREAIVEQERVWGSVLDSGSNQILGFESRPVVTLGLRARFKDDLNAEQAQLEKMGFEVLKVDRGGQATIHNPGQLVIFPICQLRDRGVSQWVDHLSQVTQKMLSLQGIEAEWDPKQPGLYTNRGKIASIGLRVRGGVSTHGIAINVANELSDFQWIRPCGQADASLDRFPTKVALEEVFALWVSCFQH